MNIPTPRFTGIFIPVEILELNDLSFFEERLLSIIDALYCKEQKGCFATNEYLAKKMKNAKVNTVVKAIVKLRKLKLIEDVSFNGRQRVIRACIGKVIENSQSQSACDLNHTLPVIKITPSIGLKSQAMDSSPIDDRKEDIKDKNIARTTSLPRKRSSDFSFSFDERKFIGITVQDIQSWKELYPQLDIQRELKEMIQWCLSNPSKIKCRTLWRKFIVSWLQKSNDRCVNRLAYQGQKQEQVLSRHTGFQKDMRPVHPSRTIDLREEEDIPCT